MHEIVQELIGINENHQVGTTALEVQKLNK
jgi:hypothetical protein